MFEEELSTLGPDDRAALQQLVTRVAELVPEAVEGRSYGVAAFILAGRPLLGFAATRDHLAVYPFSPQAVAAVAEDVPSRMRAKGTVRFTAVEPLDPAVLDRLVAVRRAEIEA